MRIFEKHDLGLFPTILKNGVFFQNRLKKTQFPLSPRPPGPPPPPPEHPVLPPPLPRAAGGAAGMESFSNFFEKNTPAFQNNRKSADVTFSRMYIIICFKKYDFLKDSWGVILSQMA